MSSENIAGYFSNGDDAHRAINQLLEEGFNAKEIGAAFHASTNRSSSRSIVETPDKAQVRSSGAADSPPAGAASGTGAVFPGGLSTGGGTPFAGANQPGPITGSEIPSNLPREIPSELTSDLANRGVSRPRSSVPVSTTSHTATTSSETHIHESWWDKLKHVFGGGEHAQVTSRREPASDKGTLDYGTGEGHLPLSSDYNYAYSGPAFESSFSGMGIPQEQARRLSRELSRGGAVVTVRAGSRNSTAEAIMQRNNGVIRYESASAAVETAWESGAQESRVEVFGEIQRVYPGYVPREDARARKAS